MKKPQLFVLVLALITCLTGCSCEHQWVDASCLNPKTCTECGAIDGEALGHTWNGATCTTPRTCTVCSATEGSSNGHNWMEATCTAPKTCSVCDATGGTANGHNWLAATCTDPQTCNICGATEGAANGHSWKTATCTAPQTCNACGATEGVANGHSWKAATCTTPKKCSVCHISEGSAIDHNYIDKICVNCGRTKPQTVVHLYQLEPCSGKNWASEKAGKDIYGNQFDKGLRSSIKSTEYLADSKYTQLKTKLIVSDRTTEKESLSLKIYADNKLIYDSGTLTYKSRPIEVILDISNATFIKFEGDWSVDASSGMYWGEILISDPVFID